MPMNPLRRLPLLAGDKLDPNASFHPQTWEDLPGIAIDSVQTDHLKGVPLRPGKVIPSEYAFTTIL